VTDLVAELRELREAEARHFPSNDHLNGWREGLDRAISLLEADPLYKAAPEMKRLLESTNRQLPLPNYERDYETLRASIQALLATLPEEDPK